MVKRVTLILGTMGTNCYLLIPEEGKEAVVVDPGADAEVILEKLQARGVHCGKIILTHAHFDHIMALEELRKATGASVYLHRADAAMLTDNDANCMNRFAAQPVVCRPADVLLEDGDRIRAGGEELIVMHTPGHTPGSVCYVAGREIFCGDTIFRGNIGRYDLPGGDYHQLIASLGKLAALEGDYRLCPGHGMSTMLEKERQTNPYLN